MNRWAREESSFSPPIRRIAGRIWASSTCSPTRFCTSTIFRNEEEDTAPLRQARMPVLPLKNQRRLSFVSGALEFFVPAFLRNVNRPQIVRVDQTYCPG